MGKKFATTTSAKIETSSNRREKIMDIF